jgi:hypothetical protein
MVSGTLIFYLFYFYVLTFQNLCLHCANTCAELLSAGIGTAELLKVSEYSLTFQNLFLASNLSSSPPGKNDKSTFDSYGLGFRD